MPPRHLAERILQSREAMEGERKQVTVLFADMKGSTELLSDRDPEEARALLDPVLKHMMDAVHNYDGTVNQVMGDGIMALFGAPLAHEDHAVRACYAALRMQEVMKTYTAAVRAAHGVEVQIRVGINSGEVVVRSIGSDLKMDYTAVGQTTHLAARMEQLATPGTIRLTGNTYGLAQGYVEVKAIGPVPVKGIAEPVQVFELAGAAARTRLEVSRARGFARFVGRDAEMKQLQRAVQEARAGRGQLVAVVGEAGVGKSRLYDELVNAHDMQGFLVLESGSVSYGKATPFLPLADLLRNYMRIDVRDDARTVRIKVTGTLLTLDEGLREAIPVLLWLLDALPQDDAFMALAPADRRRAAFDAVKRLVLRENQSRPLLIVFEDLHWIDAETQAFLDAFVESIPRARIVLAVNYRPEYRHGWTGKTYYQQMRLDPLPAESADELLTELLGTDASVANLRALLIERTEGRPLFIEESVRMLVESGALAGAPGAYRSTAPSVPLHMPATVQAIIAARIDRLELEEKRLLQAAAVIGMHVPYAVLRPIAELDEDRLRGCLGRLQAAEFLYESRIFPDTEYAFKHALTHEVAYNGILQERRTALHRAILETMERIYADRHVEHLERLAHHAVNGGVPEKALRYLREAGTRAVSRCANTDAAALFERALGVLQRLPQDSARLGDELEVRMELGPALISIKGPASAEVEQCYRRAIELVEKLGADKHRFAALWGLWYVHYNRGQSDIALKAGEQLLASAKAGNDRGHLLEAHHALFPTLSTLGRTQQASHHAEQALALYDARHHGDHAFMYAGHDPGACACWSLANLRWLAGYPDQAAVLMMEALRRVDELRHGSTTVLGLWFASWLRYQRGERQLAAQLMERLLPLAAEHGLHRVRENAALVARTIRQGEVTAADVAECARLLEAVRSSSWGQNFVVCALVELALQQGAGAHASHLLGSLPAPNRSLYMQAEFFRLEGELARAQGDKVAAEARLRQAMHTAHERGERSFELRAAVNLATLLCETARQPDARQILGEILSSFSEGYETADLRVARETLASLDGRCAL